ncbi:MAG: hypothetical protein NE328_03640 [Lentisphaeraceae bacterium]|nr:hypothetical protein [Lentisphaeraceae bacterium]
MEYVSIDMLEQGTVVAKDVRSSSNMLLLPSGTELTVSQIYMLKTWGIRRIFVDIEEDTESPEYKEVEAKLDKKIDQLFTHNDKNEFTTNLKLAVRRFHRRKLKVQK